MNSFTKVANVTQIAPDVLQLSGVWTVCRLGNVLKELDRLLSVSRKNVQLDAKSVEKIDSIAVWVLQKRIRHLEHNGTSVSTLNWPAAYPVILKSFPAITSPLAPVTSHSGYIEQIGKACVIFWHGFLSVLSFIGKISTRVGRMIRHPGQIRIITIMHNLQIAGVDALAIVGLTSFLLGIVIAYQGAAQLKHYGANIFVVELVGYAMLREFAPLMTAIIVAGRSGSSYAAQIGTMVVTEEIDALNTIGIEPIDLLVIPKLLALLLALPLLTLFADLFGVLGGMLMASSQLGVSPNQFITRFQSEIPLATLIIGIGKSFLFAMTIVVISCYQGFLTKANADSVGQQTTRSVVQSIFIVIVLDAGFSVVFNLLDL
ncbi:MlaE family ABC transporter permease [Undibacterium sp. SXout20W]|uniref:MlaE family ABC transporter permease n=1 Tax=Undibacterium sp. SXout20W TaxID=3413051 RepID=UPI003BF0FCDC